MSTPLEVFCCYAREDQEMLAHLKKHLAPLERQSLITVWSDTNLNAGVEWEKELHQHLERANIILLLISPDFMASDYCYSTEMGRAITRHNEGSAQVIPILLRSTFWQNAPFAKLQIIPTNAKPVSNWSDRDDAFHDITMQINLAISKLQTRPTLLHTLIGHTDAVTKLTIGLDGKTLISGSNDGIIKFWELPSGRELHTLPSFSKSPEPWAISSDGKIFATGINLEDPLLNSIIKLWELPSGRELRTFTGHMGLVMNITISPDNKILISSGAGLSDNIVKCWELPSGRELHTLLSHRVTYTPAISPDGKMLASSLNREIQFWELPSGRELHTLTGHTTFVKDLAISPDGKIFASGSIDKIIKLWELPSGRELHTLYVGLVKSVAIGADSHATHYMGDIANLAISSDGKILASGSADKIIKLWELPSGRELHTLIGHTDRITSVAISPDGKILASGSADQTIKLWKLML